jgi:hypothetical protein
MTQMLGGAFLPARAPAVALVVFGMLAVMLDFLMQKFYELDNRLSRIEDRLNLRP